jgi:hypothetical protein
MIRIRRLRQAPARSEDYYCTTYPEVYNAKRALVDQSADNVAKIYLRNVFPDMSLSWGAHPSNLGHNDSPGCFRCHDGSHVNADGPCDFQRLYRLP